MALYGFQKYLVDNGCKRFTYQSFTKEHIPVENYESYFVSSYGPTYFWFEYEGDIILYWGLDVAGKPPYYQLPKAYNCEVILSGDYKKDMEDIINLTVKLKDVIFHHSVIDTEKPKKTWLKEIKKRFYLEKKMWRSGYIFWKIAFVIYKSRIGNKLKTKYRLEWLQA